MNIDAEVMQQLIDWSRKGRREFEITGENEDGDCEVVVQVWVYDFDLNVGSFVDNIDELDEEYLKEKRRSELKTVISVSDEALKKLD